MTDHQWKMLVKIPRNHKFFRSELTNKVSACDDSGLTPDYTDDGPLWVETDKPIILRQQHDSANMSGSVPVIQDRTGKHQCILSGPREIMWLVRNLGMSIKIQTVDFSEDDAVVDDELDLVAGQFTKQFVPL